MPSKQSKIVKKAPNLSKVPMHKLLKLGKKAMGEKNYNGALAYYAEIWDRQPENSEIFVVLSFLLTKLAYRDQAIRLLEQALERIGPREDILHILGEMALNMSMLKHAEKIYRVNIDLYPNSLVPYNNLASVLGKLERFDEGIDLMKQMLEIYPDNATFWNTLGGLVGTRDSESAGLIFYEEALRLSPTDIRVMNNIARSYSFLDRIEEAIEMCERTLEIEPQAFDTKYLLGECLLNQGIMERGWDHYEVRRDVRKVDTLLYTNKIPDWNGSNLKGKTILIMSEQGLGDELLFASAIHHIYDYAEQVYIGCDKRLIPLFQRSFPKAKVFRHTTAVQAGHITRSFPEIEIPASKGEIKIDWRIPICSIPRYFWRSQDDLPAMEEGFLIPDPERKAHWQKELDKLGKNPKIGITWRSGTRSAIRNRYYTSLDDWGNILKTKGVTFINMQYGECEEELKLAKDKFGVTVHNLEGLDLFNGIDDSCAMFSCLDLALTPGNSPGIQAAAVGTPVWWMARGRLFWNFGTAKPKILPRSSIFYSPIEVDIVEYVDQVGEYIKQFAKTHNPYVDLKNWKK